MSEAEPDRAIGKKMGSVYVFWGDGKGKTTAALGMVLRALGHDWRVHMIQWMKRVPIVEGGAGELRALSTYDCFSVETFGDAEWLDDEPTDEHVAQATAALDAAARAAAGGEYDMLILDEILYAIEMGVVDTADVVRLLCERPRDLDVVLTGGWGEIPEITALADLVTETKRHKHPFDRGADARQGIEY
jgi:cob(I)alamin adenosyltransferase